MTCKDCFHYEACNNTYNNLRTDIGCWQKDFDDEDYTKAYCDNFTARSEWVHLPCKVGDTVWYITGIGNKLIKPAIIEGIIIDSKGIKDLYVCGNGFNFENSFDIFYLTREEAEKALEEKK
nr:MAG TPA: hypothetical protein [Caudoviricetes sp.]